MSADHWGECPRCKALAIVTHEQRKKDASDGYGTVSREKYEKLCLEAAKPIETNETFREDYQIGMYNDGTFRVNYGGGCMVCGSSFIYKHEEKVDI